jgi:hypothetical protein
MRKSNWTPSIVPGGGEDDQTVYLVADDFGKVGRAWRETDYEASDLETIVQDLLTGQYSNPIRVIAFNTAERWSERRFRGRSARTAPPLRLAGPRHPILLAGFHR